MKAEIIDVSGRVCRLYRQTEAEYLLIQPVDEHDSSLLDTEVDTIRQMTKKGAKHVLLGGYSLAGLFALWSVYQTDAAALERLAK